MKVGVANLPKESAPIFGGVPPWTLASDVTFNPTLAEHISKSEAPEKLISAAQNTLDLLPPADIIIWTDGSVVEGVRNGGSGIVIYSEHRTEITIPAGFYWSSYTGELIGIQEALSWIRGNAMQSKEVGVCTDSRSAIERLRGGPFHQRNKVAIAIWDSLYDIQRENGPHITIQWIPGHVGIPGNECADEAAIDGWVSDPMDIA